MSIRNQAQRLYDDASLLHGLLQANSLLVFENCCDAKPENAAFIALATQTEKLAAQLAGDLSALEFALDTARKPRGAPRMEAADLHEEG